MTRARRLANARQARYYARNREACHKRMSEWRKRKLIQRDAIQGLLNAKWTA